MVSGSETGVKLRYRSNYMDGGAGRADVERGTAARDGVEPDEVFEESGWYLSFDITSKPNERGLALSLRPSWGKHIERSGSLVGRTISCRRWGVPGAALVSGGGRMNAELSYGFGVSGGVEAVLSPYGKISTAEGNAHSGGFRGSAEAGQGVLT